MTPLENRLRRLQPAAAGLDRDRLLFEAGRAAQQGLTLRAPLVLATACLLVAAFAGLWWSEHRQRVAYQTELANLQRAQSPPRFHELDLPPAPVQVAEADPDSYLALRQLLSGELDSTPSTKPRSTIQASPPSSSRTLRPRDLEVDL